jgi:sigma-E factor negative regulatory protein RseC
VITVDQEPVPDGLALAGSPETAPAARFIVDRIDSSDPPPEAPPSELRARFFLFFLRRFFETGMSVPPGLHAVAARMIISSSGAPIMDCIEEGIVTRLVGTEAEVTATRAEACHACTAKGTCEAMGGSTSATVVRATNPVGARVGDRVTVRLAGSSVVGAAGLLYFFPAVALIGGAAVGHYAATARSWDADLGAAAGAALALVLSLVSVAFVGRRLGRRQSFVPRISQVTVPGQLEGVGQGVDGPDSSG